MITDHTVAVAVFHGATAAADKPPTVPTVELQAIVAKDKEIIVRLSGGRFHWSVTCKPSDVQSFARFQSVTCEALGIWIEHASQDEPRVCNRRDEWNEAVSAAFARGAAT